MKTKLERSFGLLSLFLMLIPFAVTPQGLSITAGTSLVPTNAVRIVIENAGLNIDGQFIDNNSTVFFTGSTATINSFIQGTGTIQFNNLTLNKSTGGMQLNTNIAISGSLQFLSGDSVFLNTHILDFGTTGSISGETSTKRLTGFNGGYAQVTKVLNVPVAVNPGNLGIEITSSVNMGSTIIRRGHQQQGGASILRYFDITPVTNTGLNATVRFYYFTTELSSIAEPNLAFFSSANSGVNWTNLGQSGIDQGLHILIKTGLSQLNRHTLANISDPLEVKLLYLKAILRDQKAILDWATATETDNQYFDIERSATGDNFNRLATVRGRGNSSTESYYQFTDIAPFAGFTYYRLKQVDTDGRFTYSNIVMVNDVVSNTPSIVYPNPEIEKITVVITVPEDTEYLLQMRNSNGAQVKWKKVNCRKGINTIEWTVAGLPAGLYSIIIPAPGLENLMLIKQ